MGKVVDFFSRKVMGESVRADMEGADDLAALIQAKGRYVGVLPENEAAVMRRVLHNMRSKRKQIEVLIDEYQRMLEHYFHMQIRAGEILGVKDEPFEKNELVVDKNGHCWIVPIE